MGCCCSKDKYNGEDVKQSDRLDKQSISNNRPSNNTAPPPRKNNTIRKGKESINSGSTQQNSNSLFEITDLSLKSEIIEGLQEQPNDSDLLAQMGVLLALEGKNKEAEVQFKKATESDPDNSRCWQAYGEFLERTNNPKKAIAIYSEAHKNHVSPKIALNEDDSSLLLSYAICIQKSGDIDKSEKLYKRIVTSGVRSSDSLYRYGLFLLEVKKDTEKAGIYLKDAADIDPPSAEACAAYSNYLKKYKKDDQEASKYQKRVSLYVN